MKKTYDTVVVGSGPGGAITALELLKAGFDVLLIEKGNSFSINDFDYYSYKEMENKYSNSGLTLAFGKPLINYVEGSCFGGGSEVNSGLYHRLPNEILNKWKSEFGIEYDSIELESIYEHIEKKINVSFIDHNQSLASIKLKEGSENLGYKCVDVPRWAKLENGKIIKQSMSETYLREYIDLGGKYITNTSLSRFKGVNKIKLFLNSKGKDYNLVCNKLFLCAGSIYSPYILLNSGYNKNIGNTLKMHPSFKFTAEFPEKINYAGMGVPTHQVKHFDKISMGCSISSREYIGLSLFDSSDLKHLNKWEKMATYYSMICPESLGSVSKLPFFKSPIVKFKLNNNDINKLKFGIRKLAEILFSSGARKLYPSSKKKTIITNSLELESFLSNHVSQFNLMTIHLFSSLRMGSSSSIYATNPYGRLWENPNVYINDGSILCDSPTVNPQGTIMAFAHYNVKNFINKNKNNEI